LTGPRPIDNRWSILKLFTGRVEEAFVRRAGTLATLVAGLSFLQIANAQIVVGDPNERKINTMPEYGWCWMQVGDAWYVSGVVFLPDNEFSSRFLPAFEAYLESNFGRARNGFCGEGYDTIDSSIRANPSSRYIKTGWTGGFPVEKSKGSASSARRSTPKSESAARAPAAPKGPTPNELKYQRELAAYNARLAEIERIKADTAAKHSADTLAAQQQLAQHEGDMARHRQQVAQAEAARRQYEDDLAAHQQRVSDMETKKDREAKVDWREAVVVCSLDPRDGQSQFGNWRCEGPLQMTYAKLGGAGEAPSTQAIIALSQACGGSREAVRDLGMVSSSHLFGCSYGIHPNSTSNDPAARHGIGFVPGRAIYRCPTYKSACRTQ
jgi:hypothetical protein